jgi:MoaD family protein
MKTAMMTVKVRSIGPLKALFGRGLLDVALAEGATVADLMGSMAQTYGEQASRYFAEETDEAGFYRLRVMVNGRDITVLGGRQTVLSDGDEILMLTPVAGG